MHIQENMDCRSGWENSIKIALKDVKGQEALTQQLSFSIELDYMYGIMVCLNITGTMHTRIKVSHKCERSSLFMVQILCDFEEPSLKDKF